MTTIVCFPLDVAKTRVQVQASHGTRKYGGLLKTLSTMYAEEGFRGFYRGLEPSLLTVPFFWALYFPVYHGILSILTNDNNQKSHFYYHSLAAAGSGLTANIVTNPMWVVRTRMMTDVYHRTNVAQMHTFGVMRDIVSKEGFLGLYRGLGASILGISHVVVQFPIYEKLKQTLEADRLDRKLEWPDLIVASAGSKLVASTATYPHEVLRSRQQDARGAKGGLWITFRTILHREGIAGFYQGLGINLVRVIPNCILTFVTYETTKAFLLDRELYPHHPHPTN